MLSEMDRFLAVFPNLKRDELSLTHKGTDFSTRRVATIDIWRWRVAAPEHYGLRACRSKNAYYPFSSAPKYRPDTARYGVKTSLPPHCLGAFAFR